MPGVANPGVGDAEGELLSPAIIAFQLSAHPLAAAGHQA
jgi:hypothetical protein